MTDRIYEAELHVPVEQYGFIAVKVNDTAGGLIEAYRAISEANRTGEGLSNEEFDAFIQRQVSGQPNHIEDYNSMSQEQQKYVQIIKRAIKRINYKLNEEE